MEIHLKSYTFKNTEKTKKKGSEYETFSLLFLLAFHNEHENIETVLVDTFNDVTGCDLPPQNLWDIQSKGHQDPNPKKIGSFLFTLWDNFCSEFEFLEYILLLEEIDTSYLVAPSDKTFSFDGIKKSTQERIRNGLVSEIRRRNKLKDDDKLDETKIDGFLKFVKFIVWSTDKPKSLSGLIPIKSNSFADDSFLSRVFDEIRDKQSALKNINIEGKNVNTIQEALNFEKTISKTEIVTLLVNRIIGIELFSQCNIPILFLPYLKTSDSEEIKDIILDCNAALSRTWFNKINKKAVWQLLEKIIVMITKYKSEDIDFYINGLSERLKALVPTLSQIHLAFFIARILEGIK